MPVAGNRSPSEVCKHDHSGLRLAGGLVPLQGKFATIDDSFRCPATTGIRIVGLAD